MKEIIVNEIKKNDNIIEFDFGYSEELNKYFSGTSFVIEYPENIEKVPDAIAVIPFVCNVLPIIWVTNTKLILKELDKVFFQCIPEVKKGYETMFPETRFSGEILVENIVPCNIGQTSNKAMFYSGGLDATQTLITHLDEKPDLISIWGADVKFDNKQGWDIVHTAIKEASDKYNLKDVVIHSSFREFDCEGKLSKDFGEQLKDGWWHGVKHGIGLLGHVAPYAYIHSLSTMYIASSHCAEDGAVRCASNPLIDNHVRFAKCEVIHDGFEFSRQDKVYNIVQFCRKNNIKMSLHVCWESQKGSNCCRCEKCYRTIAGLIAEGVKPEEYGFEEVETTLSDMQRNVCSYARLDPKLIARQWGKIHNRIAQNREYLKKTHYWKHVRWILKEDFMHPETIKMPLKYRLQQRLYANELYKYAHRVKERVKNGKR